MKLACSRLAVRFPNGIVAFQNVSFTARDGEFLTIVGPSGCGKTTLLRSLAGLVAPAEGSVDRGASRRILLVLQEDSLFPWMTVLENATFGLRMQGVAQEERDARARTLLARVGLEHRAGAYPHQLSLGMKQRVAVIRCFLSNPDVMLMDEPFGALDAQTRQMLQGELLALWEQDHRTVVFVTHDIEEALVLSDRILVMEGSPGSVIEELDVAFPRPRDFGLTIDPEFLAAKQHIWTRLGRSLPAHSLA